MDCSHCPDTGIHMRMDSPPPVQYQFDKHPSSQRFHDILKALGELHDKKQADYGTDEDPFNNIRASAKEWGVPAWMGAMMRGTDKLRRLQKFADTGELANESVLDAFNDLAVYAVIARVMYEEEEGLPVRTVAKRG